MSSPVPRLAGPGGLAGGRVGSVPGEERWVGAKAPGMRCRSRGPSRAGPGRGMPSSENAPDASCSWIAAPFISPSSPGLRGNRPLSSVSSPCPRRGCSTAVPWAPRTALAAPDPGMTNGSRPGAGGGSAPVSGTTAGSPSPTAGGVIPGDGWETSGVIPGVGGGGSSLSWIDCPAGPRAGAGAGSSSDDSGSPGGEPRPSSPPAGATTGKASSGAGSGGATAGAGSKAGAGSEGMAAGGGTAVSCSDPAGTLLVPSICFRLIRGTAVSCSDPAGTSGGRARSWSATAGGCGIRPGAAGAGSGASGSGDCGSGGGGVGKTGAGAGGAAGAAAAAAGATVGLGADFCAWRARAVAGSKRPSGCRLPALTGMMGPLAPPRRRRRRSASSARSSPAKGPA